MPILKYRGKDDQTPSQLQIQLQPQPTTIPSPRVRTTDGFITRNTLVLLEKRSKKLNQLVVAPNPQQGANILLSLPRRKPVAFVRFSTGPADTHPSSCTSVAAPKSPSSTGLSAAIHACAMHLASHPQHSVSP
ncbi:hypothetical protein FSOLCH5_010598 [Fusarium solani]